MRNLNYKHLHYFWVIASEGSIARAAERLFLTPQTLSGQLGQLEDSVGTALLHRARRGLQLTETGQLVFQYADEMFRLGTELGEILRGRLPGGTRPLRVAVVDVVPKLVARRLLQPALALQPPVRLVCLEGKLEELLLALSGHRIDLVLSDAPAPHGTGLRLYNHRLGTSAVSFFAAPALASRCRSGFPASLNGAPMVLPTQNTAVRRELELWFEREGIDPDIRAEFEDSALLKAFAADAVGVFPAPSVIETAITRQYGVRVVGRVEAVSERFYAVSPERRIRHPAVAAITEQARSSLFA